jgi:hypothetical protein
MREPQEKTLDRIAHAGLFLARRRCLKVAVVAGAADAGQRAHPLDRGKALRQGGCHRFDDFVDPITPRLVPG